MINIFSIADIKNQEQFLSQKAAAGKMVTKFGVITKFKPCEPCEKQFFVDILQNAIFSFFDRREKPATVVYRERWLAAGWDCVAKNGRFYVFSADKDVPLPSFFSIADQLEKLSDCSLKHEIVPMFFSMLAMIMTFTSLFGTGNRIFTDNLTNLLFFGGIISAIFAFWQLGFSLIWCVKAKIYIKYNKQKIPKVSAILSKIRYTLFAIWFLLIMPVAFVQVFLAPPSIIAFDENVHQAVRLADFGVNETQISQLTIFQSNIFVPTAFRHLEGNFSGSNVTTDIYQANFTFVADFLHENATQNLLLFSQNSGTTILQLEQSAANLWAADVGILAYSHNDFWVILRKNNTIISVSTVIVNHENVETFELADFQAVVVGVFRRLLD
ncbi:MAG: DUF2812 domain-containing protein [Defluviitaleaceae bacterium]|nr:DUF2812 domain-containing protein [Defluviitaleaceae bacterium]